MPLLPDGSFIDPCNANPTNQAAAEAMTEQVRQLLFGFLSHAAERPPMPPQQDHWRAPPLMPANGRPLAQVIDDLGQILARSVNPANPAMMGHMDTVSSVPGMLGEWVSAALNNNMLSVEMAPMLARMEHDAMREMAAWFGLGGEAGGTMLAGGSLANLQALAVARNDALACQRTGLRAIATQPVILASAAAHTSLQKAAMLLGLGSDAVLGVATDADGRMCMSALQTALQSCQTQGLTPFCIVATAGSTTSGSIDPLPQLAQICRERQLWLHVDAAYGGALIVSAQHRHLLAGIEQADSITFNPQKWLYLPKTCVALLFREQSRWHRAFRIVAPYMGPDATDICNPGEVSVQGTRHADILKLWLSLQFLGQQGQANLIDHCMSLTDFFTRQVRQRPMLQLLHSPQTNLVCFRARLQGSPAQQDAWHSALQQDLNSRNLAFFSLPVWHGQRWLRAVLLNPHLTEARLLAVFDGIDRFCADHPDQSNHLPSPP
jgi:glutamate/tyrosine decarboxylase-like PLP-dependent enzyme